MAILSKNIKRKKGNNAFVSLLNLLGIKHTELFSNKYFNEHPHKYNLLGLSKMLSDYGVENAGTKISDKEKDIFNIELPFIAFLGNGFVIVYEVSQDTVRFLWNDKDISLPVNEFIEIWTGIVLLAESSENSIEPNYKVNRKRELLNATQQYLLLFSIAVLAVLAGIANNTFTTVVPTVPIVLTALHLLGAYISYLLVQKQLHIHSSYADKICSLFKQQDCNNILESKAAKLWDVFGWSEIGLGYFLANLIILISLPHLIPYLAIINILALPYSFWSVWYQKFKAKQWCVLCLIVQVLLWLIFAVNLGFGCIQLPDFNTTSLIHGLIIACIFGTIILGINILIPNLSKGMLISYLKQEINSIKADEAVFRAMLKKRPAIETNKDDSIILFGNPDAKLQISILTNPFCNPCALMHKRVEKLLKDTENKIGIQYILSSFALELDFANKYLIAVYLGKDTAASWQIYSEWFEKGKDLKEEFFKALNLNMENPAIEAEFQKHAAWREKSKLSATPTILVNGYPLPNNYKIEDLRYFTEFNMNVK